jgi:hypothetical protein
MGQLSSSKREKKAKARNDYQELQLEKVAKIKELYSTGIPLFTKDSIRDIHQQLLKGKNGDKVSVLNLDGTKSEFKIGIGEVMDASEPENEWVQYAALSI